MLKITPEVHLIHALRAERGSFTALCAEAIDNSFDAGAHRVAIHITTTCIEITDDGCGITRDRQTAIFRLGEHAALATTALGRFGVGITMQAISAGDVLEVMSASREGRVSLRANWEDMVRYDDWAIEDAKWQTPQRAGNTGTRITIRALRWKVPTNGPLEKLREDLALMFHPALLLGHTILINDVSLELFPTPAMTNVVDRTIYVSEGKGAHVHAGILADSGARLHHVHVSYRHRVIMARSTFGCGSYGGARQLFARVDLIGEWGLAKFKDGLTDRDSDGLEDAVAEILRPLLEQCHAAQMSANVDEMTMLVNDLLPPALVPARPPRVKKPTEDDPPDSTTKRTRRRAQHNETRTGTVTPSGPARLQVNPRTQLLIEFPEPLMEEQGYGCFLPGRPNRIQLAADHPDIAALLAYRDRPLAARALLGFALMLYEEARGRSQRELPGIDSFGLRVSRLMVLQTPGPLAADAVPTPKEQRPAG